MINKYNRKIERLYFDNKESNKIFMTDLTRWLCYKGEAFFMLMFARSCEYWISKWQKTLTRQEVISIIDNENVVKNDMEVRRVKMSYKKLWILLVEKDISQATLRKDLNIATGTMTKLRRNEEVALSVLLRICEYLDCNIGDVCDAVREE